jgi:dihydrodipicolinate synthase/N-acetylneuraminate lyase
MGEGQHLAHELREEVIEKSLVVVRGSIPLFIWISDQTEEGTRSNLSSLKKIIEKRKYQGTIFWVDTPLFYHSNRGLQKHYHELSSISEQPIILSNDPELVNQGPRPFKRNNIRTSILKELVLIENIEGLIFSGSLERVYNYQRAVRGRRDFRIYDGDESRFLRHPSISGVISAGANLAPKIWQRITAASLTMGSDRKEYPSSLKQIWEMGMFLNNLRDLYNKDAVPIIKRFLSDAGIIENPTSYIQSKDLDKKSVKLKNLIDSMEPVDNTF